MADEKRLLTIVETPIFARRRPHLLNDDEYRLAQIALAANPALGEVIVGGGGIRKARWELQGRGKRGGSRVIYYWAVGDEVVLLLYVYAKGDLKDLTKDQLKVLSKLVTEEFK